MGCFMFSTSMCVVCHFLGKGANIKKADKKGRTPLHFAACRGDTRIGQYSNISLTNCSDVSE